MFLVLIAGEDEFICLKANLSDRLTDPLSFFVISYTVSPPPIHAAPDSPRIQFVPLALLIKDVKKKSCIEVFQSKLRKAFQDPGYPKIIVR